MRKYLSLSCLAGILFLSCSKSGVNGPSVPRLDSINSSNFVIPMPYQNTYNDPTTYQGSGIAYFTYDHNGRVTKRVIQSAYNHPYDTVIYKSPDDVILIYIVNAGSFETEYLKREIIFSGGLVKWKIYHVPTGGGAMRMDTVEYIHNRLGQLTMTKGHFSNANLESNFYYSNAGNLDSVISMFRNKRTGLSQGLKEEERFGDYDNKANPLKGNCLWDDLLYRSLSNNNFASYFFRSGGVGWGSWSWRLNYKPNGDVDFSK